MAKLKAYTDLDAEPSAPTAGVRQVLIEVHRISLHHLAHQLSAPKGSSEIEKP